MELKKDSYISKLEKIKKIVSDIEMHSENQEFILRRFKKAVKLLSECENQIRTAKKDIIKIIDKDE